MIVLPWSQELLSLTETSAGKWVKRGISAGALQCVFGIASGDPERSCRSIGGALRFNCLRKNCNAASSYKDFINELLTLAAFSMRLPRCSLIPGVKPGETGNPTSRRDCRLRVGRVHSL